MSLCRSLVLTAVLSCAAALQSLVPIGFELTGDGGATYILQNVDVLVRNSDPNRYPMFTDLPKSGPTRRVSYTELKAHLDSTSAEGGFGLMEVNDGTSTQNFKYANPTPSGFIFHEARVGSTLGANSKCGRWLGVARRSVVVGRVVWPSTP